MLPALAQYVITVEEGDNLIGLPRLIDEKRLLESGERLFVNVEGAYRPWLRFSNDSVIELQFLGIYSFGEEEGTEISAVPIFENYVGLDLDDPSSGFYIRPHVLRGNTNTPFTNLVGPLNDQALYPFFPMLGMLLRARAERGGQLFLRFTFAKSMSNVIIPPEWGGRPQL